MTIRRLWPQYVWRSACRGLAVDTPPGKKTWPTASSASLVSTCPCCTVRGPALLSDFRQKLSAPPKTTPSSYGVSGPPDSLVHVFADEVPSSSQRSRASVSQTPLGSILAGSPRDFSNNQSWSPWTNIRANMPVFGEPLQLTNRGLRLTLFVKEITAQDMENAKNPLAHSLNAFFRCLSDDGFADFVTRVRPIHGSSLRPLSTSAPSRPTADSQAPTNPASSSYA